MFRFTDNSHPEANGRQAKEGEESFELPIPLECGESLRLRLGRGGMAILMAWGQVTVGEDQALWDEIDRIAGELAQDDASKE